MALSLEAINRFCREHYQCEICGEAARDKVAYHGEALRMCRDCQRDLLGVRPIWYWVAKAERA